MHFLALLEMFGNCRGLFQCKKKFKIFVEVTMNQKPLLFGQLLENKEVECGYGLSGELL